MILLSIIRGLLLLPLGLTNTYLPRPPCEPTNVILQCLQRRTNVPNANQCGRGKNVSLGEDGMYNKILIISGRITRLAPTSLITIPPPQPHQPELTINC